MAADFWSSSHYKRWIVDRATLKQARAEDMRYVKDPLFFDLFNIFTGNLIARICKRMSFRQRVTATASVFLRRFYLKNSYCETDPFIVIAACCYVAAKAEESPVHIKTVVNESRSVFSRLGVKNFPSDNSKLAEMEFYLVSDLECDLVVFHPYRTLMAICGKEGGKGPDQEAGELGFGVNDGPRYWGTGEGKLMLHESAFQNVWLIINDLYRTDLCLIYPPHLIAIGALMVTVAYHGTTKPIIQQAHNERTAGNSHKSQSSPQPRRSGRTGHGEKEKDKKPPQDVIGFLAGLNVSMSAVGVVVQEILSFYTLWDLFADEKNQSASKSGAPSTSNPLSRNTTGVKRDASGNPIQETVPPAPIDLANEPPHEPVTAASMFQAFIKMREARIADLANPRPPPVNKVLEKTQSMNVDC